jgi:hypothetical protein
MFSPSVNHASVLLHRPSVEQINSFSSEVWPTCSVLIMELSYFLTLINTYNYLFFENKLII